MNDLDDWELRLEELGVSGSVCNLRLSDGGRIESIIGERDLGVVEGDEHNIEMGEERTRLESERIDE